MVCSTFKTLHDLSSNRRKPDWFLSLKKIYLVRKDQ
uniref:Spider venom protein NPTX_B154 n=1 Tax=Nephila pilipes TaxID=299642 RepID=A0A1X9PYG4_NEPPI|nr:spider venom protein NPTX_B154 [Nephila pilipes]